MPLKGRVVIVQGSAESEVRLIPSIAGEAGDTSENHPYTGKNGQWVQDSGRVCEIRKERGSKQRPWLRTRVQRRKGYPIAVVLYSHIEGLNTEVEFTL